MMKIKDLINKLSKFDPDTQIKLCADIQDDYCNLELFDGSCKLKAYKKGQKYKVVDDNGEPTFFTLKNNCVILKTKGCVAWDRDDAESEEEDEDDDF
jgi:hypothetical protein